MKAPFVLLICVFTGFFAACQQKPSSPEERSEPLAFSPTDPVQTSRWLMDVLKPFEAANESQNELKWAESAKNLLSSLRPFEEAEVIWPFTVVSVSPSGIAASLRIPDEAHDKVIVHNSKGAKHTWHDEILITAPAEKLKELNRGDTIRAKGRLKFETRGPWVAGVVVVIESFSLTP